MTVDCVCVCVCLQGVEVLINCKSSGCNVCFLAAGRQPRCYQLAARTFSRQVYRWGLIDKSAAVAARPVDARRLCCLSN